MLEGQVRIVALIAGQVHFSVFSKASPSVREITSGYASCQVAWFGVANKVGPRPSRMMTALGNVGRADQCGHGAVIREMSPCKRGVQKARNERSRWFRGTLA